VKKACAFIVTGFFVAVCYGLICPMQNKNLSIVNGVMNGAVSSQDRGLAYGDGVFRTLKVVNGLPEQWPLQYQMLEENCTALGIVCPSAELFVSDFLQLFLAEETAVAKIIVTRGDGERGYAPPAITEPTRIVIKSSMPDYPKANFSEGVQLHLCKTRLAYQPALAGVKHLNRMENVLARMEWNDPAVVEGLLQDMAGDVIECTASNLFARFDDTLITPNLDQCGVAGVTRQRILSLAHTIGFKVKIETIPLEKVLSADEIVICNSLYGAWQVRKLSNKTWEKKMLALDIRKALAI
jgi:4-amino-4-deoxychorismate lyase